jgi:hypothetical protein
MRTSILVLSFLFAIASVVAAEDLAVPSKPASQRAVHAPARVHNPSPRPPAAVRGPVVNPNRNHPAHHANQNARRNFPPGAARLNQHPGVSQPVRRMPIAMTTRIDARNHPVRHAREQLEAREKGSFQAKTSEVAVKNRQTDNRHSYFEALKRFPREPRDRNWWRKHCKTIVFIPTGYYYLDANYWYPAFGYDLAYDYSEYNGPIYTYGNLLPDQVIANVQRALQEIGYYVGPITGSLGPATRAAISHFQRDYGLIITGAPDEPTVMSLGLM